MSVRSSLGRFGIVTVEAMRAILDHEDGSPTVLAVYVALATHADRDEEMSWRCSVKAIAAEAGVSDRSVIAAKKVLIEIGLLDVTPNYLPDGNRGWDSYLLHYAPTPASDSGGGESPAGGGESPAVYSSDQETDQETEPPKPPKGGEVEIVDQDFESFYARYPPGRRNRAAAVNRWARLTKAQKAQALDALPVWLDYWERAGTDSQFIPAPEVWLGTKRSKHYFESEVPLPPKKKQSSIMESISKIRERDSQ